MASLIAKSATEGLLPVRAGALTLDAGPMEQITSIAAYSGREGEVAAILEKAGLGWPAPGSSFAKGEARILWTGRAQAFLIGAPAPKGLGTLAQVTDQSDGWIALRVAGAGGPEALARLVAIDLSPAAFPAGSAARTGLGHMAALFHRETDDVIVVHVFRSMVRTAIHEIGQAMRALAARATA